MYTDQTGKFPYVSNNGAKYIMIMYYWDCNVIMSTPLRSETGLEQLRSLKNCMTMCVNKVKTQHLTSWTPRLRNASLTI